MWCEPCGTAILQRCHGRSLPHLCLRARTPPRSGPRPVDLPSPLDSSPLAAPSRSVPTAPLGSFLPPAPPGFSVALALPWIASVTRALGSTLAPQILGIPLARCLLLGLLLRRRWSAPWSRLPVPVLPYLLKMKYCKIFLFLLLMIMGVSTNAQEVTCEGEQLINVDIVVGNPGIAPPYKPGHILVFRCTDVKLKMHGQQVIECLSNGKWDYPYPKCGDVTCLLNTKKENIKMDRFPDFECPVTPGYNLTFSCNGQGLILKGQREITCQSNGEWSSPFPKCEDKHTE
ncbi:hypothetical protein cypCar_00046014, partial [Cyprinus carpio]